MPNPGMEGSCWGVPCCADDPCHAPPRSLDVLRLPVITLCKHIFCKRCIDAVIARDKPSCPMCRGHISGKHRVHALRPACHAMPCRPCHALPAALGIPSVTCLGVIVHSPCAHHTSAAPLVPVFHTLQLPTLLQNPQTLPALQLPTLWSCRRRSQTPPRQAPPPPKPPQAPAPLLPPPPLAPAAPRWLRCCSGCVRMRR